MRLRAKFFVKTVSVIILLCFGTIALFIRLDTLNEGNISREAVAGAPSSRRAIAKSNKSHNKEKGTPIVLGLVHVNGVEVNLERYRKEHGIDEQIAKHRNNDRNFRQSSQDSEHGHGPKRKIQPAVLKDTRGNFEVRNRPNSSGPGEYGVAVKLDPDEQEAYDRSIKEYGFNVVISDKISLDRSVPDIRHRECAFWHYPEDLPKASVIIVFHNEGWTTLLRTVHSVFNTSPPKQLAEVVMVDDYSDKGHLGSRLDKYLLEPRFEGKIKMVRNDKREGLIRSRSIGAEHASHGGALVFLDAHCECNINWLPPLLTRIALNRTTVACPTVDSIDSDTFAYGPQLDGICRGAFDWELYYKRIPIGEVETKRRKHESEPYPSPVMAGGLFAIDRSYFFELGGYDPGLKIWGAEQYELSFKIWMCGGTLEFVPCSRVAHIYRKLVPYTYPDTGGSFSVVHQNHMRVVEVWMDEYKKYFYANQPSLIGKPYGDISQQIEFRRKNCPRSFKWFLEEVAYDLLPNYPLPSANKYWGEIRAVDTEICLDTLGQIENGRVGVSGCHGMGGNQLFRINEVGEFRILDMCLFVFSKTLILNKCAKGKGIHQTWDYIREKQMIVEVPLDACLTYKSESQTVSVERCDETKASQKWEINHIN
ncbi:N-acetylgalactosaminyltransferase 7-like [Ptychodera flava]|uniref:N-acetylgalactosaminyltransferase 7-like n=1 Tax=Ptychodera flava TaxID=63121 RepID=UPI00396A9C42